VYEERDGGGIGGEEFVLGGETSRGVIKGE